MVFWQVFLTMEVRMLYHEPRNFSSKTKSEIQSSNTNLNTPPWIGLYTTHNLTYQIYKTESVLPCAEAERFELGLRKLNHTIYISSYSTQQHFYYTTATPQAKVFIRERCKVNQISLLQISRAVTN